jgi:hypothetical protein
MFNIRHKENLPWCFRGKNGDKKRRLAIKGRRLNGQSRVLNFPAEQEKVSYSQILPTISAVTWGESLPHTAFCIQIKS